MALRKLRLASSRCSAGDATLMELGSELWDSDDRPRVKRAGLPAMVAGWGKVGGRKGEWEGGGKRGKLELLKGACSCSSLPVSKQTSVAEKPGLSTTLDVSASPSNRGVYFAK